MYRQYSYTLNRKRNVAFKKKIFNTEIITKKIFLKIDVLINTQGKRQPHLKGISLG
jgi:hypothetical protein